MGESEGHLQVTRLNQPQESSRVDLVASSYFLRRRSRGKGSEDGLVRRVPS